MKRNDESSSGGFEQLLRPHMERLYRLAFRLAGNKAEAEDLFQDVLTKTYVRLDDLAEIDEPGPWLSRVMYNHFIDNRRKYSRQRLVIVEESRLPGDSVESLPGGSNPELDAEKADNIIRLEAALAELSDDHRRLVLLHDTEGYKLSEIQELTGDPIGTIKSRLHRARAHLRELLANDGTFF
jgi:RNA polymerase sigma-70 factor (ECF subfamily)